MAIAWNNPIDAFRLIQAYKDNETNISRRARDVERAFEKISARGRRVYVKPGGAPIDVFRTFDEDTAEMVVLVLLRAT